jgi:hypothetical protein
MGMQPLGASDAAKPALEHAMLTEIRVAFTVSLDLDLDLTRQPKVPEPQPPGAAKPDGKHGACSLPCMHSSLVGLSVPMPGCYACYTK